MKFLAALLLSTMPMLAQLGPHSDQAFLGQFFPSGGSAGQTIASGWAGRVVANGGATPSANSITAQANFWDKLVTDGIASKMTLVNSLVPDSLIACATPLLVGPGVGLWTNFGGNFVAANLTTNGIGIGAGAGAFYQLGCSPESTLIKSDHGYTIYIYNGNSNSEYDFGAGNDFASLYQFGNVGSQTCFNDTGSVRIRPSNSGWQGMISCIRSNDMIRVYRASSAVAPEVIASGTLTGQAVPSAVVNLQFYLRGANQAGLTSPSTRSYSFFAIHKGLNIYETSNLFVAIQTMRTNLGGGYR